MVIKRDGRKCSFDKEKIINAITKAFIEVDGELSQYAKTKTHDIANYIEKINNDLNVEEIQDIIESKLMSSNRKDVAKAYIIYREKRSKIREQNSELIKKVKKKLNAENIVNQNANVDEKSFGGRIGEASDEVLKDVALNHCMSEMSKNNHLNNEIYIHDLNSYSVGMHNCYDSGTKFITSEGVKKFGECCDGQKVKIVDKDGYWRDATVRNYGKKQMYNLTFKSGLTTKTVTCTRDHRWVLEDGTVTTNIDIGDSLYLAHTIKSDYTYDNKLWCFGFVIGDGNDFYMKSKDRARITNSGMNIRLCGHKTKYLDRFLKAGWSIRQQHDNGDITLISRGNGSYKQLFLKNKLWKLFSYNDLCNIFDGYIHADGHFRDNGSVMVSTSDFKTKEFIEYTSSVLGYYVWSIDEKYNSTNFKENRTLYDFYLTKKQSTKWTLVDIKKDHNGDNGYKVAWCIEEPITHTFTLDGAMVTGNCLSIPFDKLLANGFNTRQTDVRPANSVNTAFQLVAVIFQLQSLQEFGGVSATHLDWTMVPYVRKSFRKHYLDGLKYLGECNSDLTDHIPIDAGIEDEEYKIYPKTYEYALDMTTKEVYQAVEGMYHNLNVIWATM